MIDKIQAAILESLNNTQNFEGKVVADKFDELSLSDFSKGIYSNLPLYTDEIVDIILNFVRSFKEDAYKQYSFIKEQLGKSIHKLVLNNDTSIENLTSVSIWSNVLNKYINSEIEIHSTEEEYKNYLMSYLSPDINSIQEEIKEDKIQAITIPAGNYFIRLDSNNNLVPTKNTKENYINYLKL